MDQELIASILYEKGLIDDRSIEFEPLKGGISSDIYKISDGQHTYVVKQALPKLKVQDDWYAEVSRNIIEQDFIHFMQSNLPDSVSKIFYADRKHCFFVMEYLDDDYQNWKQQLLNGCFEARTAIRAAELLAEIHIKSRDREDIKNTFNHAANFYGLRIEPYLVATGEHHPELKYFFLEEAERLKHHREALVHGDYSPKNMMIKENRLIILDHEAAWFGDPAFDLAFFLNHLYLKMLFHFFRCKKMNDLTTVAFSAYMNKWVGEKKEEMEIRTGRLLLMLMLARMDGKSPVEYFNEKEIKFVRSFVHELLPAQIFSHSMINHYWNLKLKSTAF